MSGVDVVMGFSGVSTITASTCLVILLVLTPTTGAGVIGSDVPWLECPACNALTWVITVTE